MNLSSPHTFHTPYLFLYMPFIFHPCKLSPFTTSCVKEFNSSCNVKNHFLLLVLKLNFGSFVLQLLVLKLKEIVNKCSLTIFCRLQIFQTPWCLQYSPLQIHRILL